MGKEEPLNKPREFKTEPFPGESLEQHAKREQRNAAMRAKAIELGLIDA